MINFLYKLVSSRKVKVAYLDSLDSRLSGSFVCKRTRTSFSGKDAISLLKVSIRGEVLAATLLQTYADES